MSVGRFGSMVFGRALLVLRNFETRTIIRLTALYAVAEMALFCYAVLKGPKYVLELLRIWKWMIANAAALVRMRNQVQGTRRVPDRDLLPLVDTMFEVGPLGRESAGSNWGRSHRTHLRCVSGMRTRRLRARLAEREWLLIEEDRRPFGGHLLRREMDRPGD